MRQLTSSQIHDLMTFHEPPCISLYQFTNRHRPDNQQDPIRYKNLIRELESSLGRRYPARQTDTIMENFRKLEGDTPFWNHRTEGLAVFASPALFEVIELQLTVPELVIVADSFHIKPLLRIIQTTDRYQILCLNRHSASLYEGNRYALDLVELTNVPSTITEALGEELTEPHQTVASYGKGSGTNATPMRHSHGAKKDEVDIDMERFFRVIDRGVLEHHSKPSGLPLVLAALSEYHTPFRSISHNPFLAPVGITTNPDSLSLDQLRLEAWKKIEPLYHEQMDNLIAEYQEAKSRKLGSDDVDQTVKAAGEGRIDTLLLEADRQLPGKIMPETGEIHRSELSEPDMDDVFDDLAEMTLRAKGKVVIIPPERMPSGTGLAAIYRY
jgi:hypothetical protein